MSYFGIKNWQHTRWLLSVWLLRTLPALLPASASWRSTFRDNGAQVPCRGHGFVQFLMSNIRVDLITYLFDDLRTHNLISALFWWRGHRGSGDFC